MRRIGLVLAVAAGFGPAMGAVAQGTKLWSVGRYDEMERGSREGVAIRSDGRLELGPASSLVYTATGSYVWGLAADGAGDAYVGVGGSTAGSAAVMRVGPDGKAAKIFEGKELAVQAVRLGPGGALVVATNPEGKVYRVPAGGGSAAVVFDPALTAEKPKYLWDVAVGGDGRVYVATGAPAAVYRLPTGGGKAELLFRTADQHIRCLLLAGDGTLWAGSDGAGVVYRFETRKAGAKPFAAYAAARKEITALAMDGAGNVYAAGVGAKGAGGAGLPPLPVTGNVGVTLTFVQAGSGAVAVWKALLPEVSEVYRIGVDGAPLRMVTLKDDVVYGLAVRDEALLAATGNRGVVYRIDLLVPGRFADLLRLGAAQGMVFAPGKGGLLVGTSNSGKVFRMEDGPARDATYTSDVFDAQGFARWGRVEVQNEAIGGAVAKFDLLVRSGNVPSPVEGWSDWVRTTPNAGAAGAPAGRYVQWRVDLRPGALVTGVGVNYLPKNMAPAVDEVVVATGARVTPAGGVGGQSATVQIAFPVAAAGGAGAAINFVADANATPLTAQKDRAAVTVRWAAHDDNGDDLMFAVWYRGEGERNWRLLKDKISERYLSFDSSLLPDGAYTLKVVASDAPVHADRDALTGERESAGFTVDTTPPVPGVLAARMEAGAGAGAGPRIRARFEARDQTSPIAHAEYSVDAGPWQYLEPVGGLSDSLLERYEFVAEVPEGVGRAGVSSQAEHVLAVRVYDRFENAVSVKTVVR